MAILPTLTENDLQTIGVISFGARRKLSLLVKQLNPSPQAINMMPVPVSVRFMRTLKEMGKSGNRNIHIIRYIY